MLSFPCVCQTHLSTTRCSTFGLLESSPFFSSIYTLFGATELPHLFCNQFVAHSFHPDGGCTPAVPTSLLPYFHTSLFPPVPTGSNPPARLLDFPPVSFAGAESYIEAVPVQGEAMNEFTSWVQSNWFELGNLLCQFIFLAAGIWFARKILRTLRASQEQAGALLKLSVTGAISERQSSSATNGNGGSFANASPYWLTPGEMPPADPAAPPESGSSEQASNGHGHGLMAWLNEPMSYGGVAPWRSVVSWLKSPVGS